VLVFGSDVYVVCEPDSSDSGYPLFTWTKHHGGIVVHFRFDESSESLEFVEKTGVYDVDGNLMKFPTTPGTMEFSGLNYTTPTSYISEYITVQPTSTTKQSTYKFKDFRVIGAVGSTIFAITCNGSIYDLESDESLGSVEGSPVTTYKLDDQHTRVISVKSNKSYLYSLTATSKSLTTTVNYPAVGGCKGEEKELILLQSGSKVLVYDSSTYETTEILSGESAVGIVYAASNFYLATTHYLYRLIDNKAMVVATLNDIITGIASCRNLVFVTAENKTYMLQGSSLVQVGEFDNVIEGIIFDENNLYVAVAES